MIARRQLICSTILIAAVPLSSAQDDGGRAKFAALVLENAHPMIWSEEGPAGPGLEWLVAEGASAQYFLIGERHGLAQIPQVASTLYGRLVEHGYRHAALEIGPFAARKTEELFEEGGVLALAQFFSSPIGDQSIAFLSWEEEGIMAAEMFAASEGRRGTIWGLDQEFLASFGMITEFLGERAETEAQREAIAAQRAACIEDPFHFLSLTPDELRAFSALFGEHSSPEVRQVLSDLEVSHHIYGAFVSPPRLANAASNIRREDLIKENFLTEVAAAEKRTGRSPKVLFKFGGFHVGVGVDNRTGRVYLGTFIEAYARAHGRTAFNLYVEAYSGSNRSSGQDSGSGDNVLTAGSAFGDVASQSSTHPFADLLRGSQEPLLIDLRPLRQHLTDFPFLERSVRTLLVGFDAYLALPNVTPSTPFEKL